MKCIVLDVSILQELNFETYSQYHSDNFTISKIKTAMVSDYFVIGNILGSGESCVVFDALFIPANSRVAMKYIQNYSQYRKSILRELQVLRMSAGCRHLVGYHSHFRVGLKCYIITELLSKVNMSQLLDPHLNLPPALTRIYMKQLSKALIYLHEHKIIHRDVTLKNLALDFKGNLRLIDYNMSRLSTDTMGMSMSDMGSLLYAAPEIFKDKLCSFPVDWWSAGVCLYRFITGGFPYPTTNRRVYSYYIIKNHVVVYPAQFFDDDLLMAMTKRLLGKKSITRLGTFNDKEIMNHPYFEGIDWAENDDIHKAILESSPHDLKWYKDSYKNILNVLDQLQLQQKQSTSQDVRKWATVESILYDKAGGYGRKMSRKPSLSAGV